MNAKAIEAQVISPVREILGSRLSLSGFSSDRDSSSTSSDKSGPSEPQFAAGDIVLVDRSFLEQKSYKNPQPLAFKPGLRLFVVTVDLVGNIRVNTHDRHWSEDLWILKENLGNLSLVQPSKPAMPKQRNHGRALSLNPSSLSQIGYPVYTQEEQRTPTSPDFTTPPKRNQPKQHRRHMSEAFNLPNTEHARRTHRRIESNKDDLRARIRNALARRNSGETPAEPVAVPKRRSSYSVGSYVDLGSSQAARRMIPPKIETNASNPSLERVKQRESARTPVIVEKNQVVRTPESIGTPRNAFATPRASPTEHRLPEAPKPKQNSRRRKSSVVFCDCDGVLNTAYTPVGEDGLPLDMILVERVARLCREAKANIVLTSTWREDQVAYGKLFRTFQSKGVTVLGRTPSLGSRSREILAWLTHNQRHVRNWTILDDRMDLFTEKYNLVSKHLVLVDEDVGVTEVDMQFAMSILCPTPVTPSALKRKRLGNVDLSSESMI